ncbi:hypothetical protein ACHWQZ_G001373 [Mnemiopsis leidyi]
MSSDLPSWTRSRTLEKADLPDLRTLRTDRGSGWRSGSLDGPLAYKMIESYFCKGDRTWSHRIQDPALKWFLQISQNIVCRFKNDLTIEGIREPLIRLAEAMNGTEITPKSKACLWDGAKVVLNSAFCEEKILETLMELLTVAWCRMPEFREAPVAEVACKIGNFVLYYTSGINKVLSVLANCNTEQKSERIKRQYDLQSMVHTIEQVVCFEPTEVVSVLREFKMELGWLDLSDKEDAAAIAKIFLPLLCCMNTSEFEQMSPIWTFVRQRLSSENSYFELSDKSRCRTNSAQSVRIRCILQQAQHLRKPTHTNLYTKYSSCTTNSSKNSVIRSLTRRAYNLCSPQHLDSELQTVRHICLLNGFPPQRITSIMEEVRRRFLNPPRRQTPNRQTPNYSLSISLPYHPSLSKPLKNILGQHDIKVTHSSSTTLRNLLTKTKTTPPPDLTPHTIYEISCLDCTSTYNGQTYRPLIHRMKEHERCHRLNNAYDETLDKVKSAPAHHSLTTGHRIAWNDITILKSLPSKAHLDLTEQAAIHIRNPSMNRTDSAPKCSSLWNPILPKIAATLKPTPSGITFSSS